MLVANTLSLVESWEEPPPVRQGRRAPNDERPWHQLAETLRERSGEWALLSAGLPIHTAQNIAGARLAPFRPAGSFDAVSRDGRIYVRHVGSDHQEAR